MSRKYPNFVALILSLRKWTRGNLEWRCSDNDNYVRPRDQDFECSRSIAIIYKRPALLHYKLMTFTLISGFSWLLRNREMTFSIQEERIIVGSIVHSVNRCNQPRVFSPPPPRLFHFYSPFSLKCLESLFAERMVKMVKKEILTLHLESVSHLQEQNTIQRNREAEVRYRQLISGSEKRVRLDNRLQYVESKGINVIVTVQCNWR